jgi:hypothetical protein
MTRLQSLLILPGILLGLALAGAPARGGFTLTTTVTGVSESGGMIVNSSILAPGSSFPIDSSTITVANGGYSFTDSAGTTVYFLNDSQTFGSMAVANEQVYVANTTMGATDAGVFTFTVNISVTNNGDTKSFSEGPDTVTLDLTNANANYLVAVGTLAPPSELIGGVLVSSSMPQAVSGQIDSANNGGVSAVISSAVPEPSSLVLLGVGGLLVIASRRHRLASLGSRI